MGIPVQIKINKEAMYHDVMMEAEYTGAKSMTSEDQAAYDRMRIVDENRELLDTYMARSVELLRSAFGEYLESVEEDADKVCYILIMPGNFKMVRIQEIAASAMEYVKQSILLEWYRKTSPAQCEAVSALATTAVESIVKGLDERCRPSRETTSGNSAGGVGEGVEVANG